MSDSRLKEIAALIEELGANDATLDAAIIDTEYRLHLLRSIRQTMGRKNSKPTRGRKEKTEPASI